MTRLRSGDLAPTFDAIDHHGRTVSLSALLGDGPLVLYFYPRDETPGCTAQACAFRDAYEDFRDAGAQVVGVSSDSHDSHRAFAENHHLPFPLLSDAAGSLRRAYGVTPALGLLPGRVTFVIDTTGVIRHVFRSALRAERHMTTALEIIHSLRPSDDAPTS